MSTTTPSKTAVAERVFLVGGAILFGSYVGLSWVPTLIICLAAWQLAFPLPSQLVGGGATLFFLLSWAASVINLQNSAEDMLAISVALMLIGIVTFYHESARRD